MNDEQGESAVETDDRKSLTTPAHSVKGQNTISGWVIKHVFCCKGMKIKYRTLDDPFVTMDIAKNENGKNISGEPSSIESEDTYATDGSSRMKEAGKDIAMIRRTLSRLSWQLRDLAFSCISAGALAGQ